MTRQNYSNRKYAVFKLVAACNDVFLRQHLNRLLAKGAESGGFFGAGGLGQSGFSRSGPSSFFELATINLSTHQKVTGRRSISFSSVTMAGVSHRSGIMQAPLG
jgi:hypothetical protein